MAKSKKQVELEQQIGEITQDLQRTRADFENYRKRVDAEKNMRFDDGQASAVLKLLPVIDNIERAIGHTPKEIADNKWVQGVASLVGSLDKQLLSLGIERIVAEPGTLFDPSVHEAVQVDEESEGDKEVVAEELQAGYKMNGSPIRPAMVKVTKIV